MTDEKKMILVNKDFLNAVAHIGFDFGYGPYQLDREHIQYAQVTLTKYEEDQKNKEQINSEPQTNNPDCELTKSKINVRYNPELEINYKDERGFSYISAFAVDPCEDPRLMYFEFVRVVKFNSEKYRIWFKKGKANFETLEAFDKVGKVCHGVEIFKDGSYLVINDDTHNGFPVRQVATELLPLAMKAVLDYLTGRRKWLEC